MSAADQRRYAPVIGRMVDEFVAAAAIGSAEYRELSKTYFDDLFVDLKASWNRVIALGRENLSRYFVKTQAYMRFTKQQSFFVVGRRGSGKSTLTQVLPLLHEKRYYQTVRFDVDETNLDALYSIYCDPQFRSDTRTTVSRQAGFESAWEAALPKGFVAEEAGMPSLAGLVRYGSVEPGPNVT